MSDVLYNSLLIKAILANAAIGSKVFRGSFSAKFCQDRKKLANSNVESVDRKGDQRVQGAYSFGKAA